MFNDEEVYDTKALPDLHDKFRNPISLGKGSIELTPDKCKTVMTDSKKKVMKTIAKYNLSGNGADMAVFEDDQDGKVLFTVHHICPTLTYQIFEVLLY